ncbi:MAG: ketopantoate reductase family protein [Gemmatimonadaceae bacterium]
MKVGIIGAGGIGGYFAGILRRIGVEVRLVARGDHLAAIQSRGLEIRTANDTYVVQVDAAEDGDFLRGCDYVIVAVKGYSLPEIAPMTVAAAKSGAAIVPLLNGVDIVQQLEAHGVPPASIIGGLAKISVFRIEPGVIERKSPFQRATLGEFDRTRSDRVKRLVDVLEQAGMDANISGDIGLDLWRKFAFIVPMTVACGLSREPAGRVNATDRGRALVASSLHEIVEVSRAVGVALSDADEAQVKADLYALPAGMYPSFYMDLVRGGPAETETLAGAVSRLGRAHGIPTPVHDVATAAFEVATLPRS